MNLLFRADASSEIGSGHIRRCLTLAEAIQRLGTHKIQFMSDLSGATHLRDNLTNLGINVLNPLTDLIPTDTDWLIIDHYKIDIEWETKHSQENRKILVIDDLANRKHLCDVLLDQNYFKDIDSRYTNLVPKNCNQLLGPRYSLLRTEFSNALKKYNRKFNSVNSLLINFGGTDPVGMTLKALLLVKDFDLQIDVVVGQGVSDLEEIKKNCTNKNIKLHIQTNKMAEIILNSDLAIAANGTSTWERSCLGLPTISISIADNQVELSKCLHEINGCFYIGHYSDNDISFKIKEQLNSCMNDPQNLEGQSQVIRKLSDGQGADYVAKVICD